MSRPEGDNLVKKSGEGKREKNDNSDKTDLRGKVLQNHGALNRILF